MREVAPFQPADLAELDERLLSRAGDVVPMGQVDNGDRRAEVIAMRHDVDNALNAAVALAEWEHQRGYRSTYFILHTAPYWHVKAQLRASLDRIAELGHEIGFHSNAITLALETGGDPHEIVASGLAELRAYGHQVRGIVAHGDPLCYVGNYVNDEQFIECARPDYGAPDRELVAGELRLKLEPRSLADFGLEYDSNRLSRAFYLSDSGGRWSTPFHVAAAGYPYDGQTHVLHHPCWWAEALAG